MLTPVFDFRPSSKDRGPTDPPNGPVFTGGGTSFNSIKICAQPPAASELGSFETSRSELRVQAAAKLGLTLLSSNVSGRRLIVVQDFYRGAFCQSEDGWRVLYGVSARLVVDLAGFEARAQLTLPAIAAQVEIGMATASYKLGARGYVGSISQVLVSPTALNVENYVALTGSIELLQKLLADDIPNLRPEPLFVDMPAQGSVDSDYRWSVGLVFALSQVAERQSLSSAKKAIVWETWSDEARSAIEELYLSTLRLPDSDSRPDGAMQSWARSYLGKLRLR